MGGGQPEGGVAAGDGLISSLFNKLDDDDDGDDGRGRSSADADGITVQLYNCTYTRRTSIYLLFLTMPLLQQVVGFACSSAIGEEDIGES